MKKLSGMLIVYIGGLALLTGCWDEQLLKERSLIKAVGFDGTGVEGEVRETLSTTVIDNKQMKELNISVTEKSPRAARNKLERIVHENLDPSKNRVVLISQDIAQKDIYPVLDIFYRDPISSLTAKIAITEVAAETIIKKPVPPPLMSGEFLSNLLENLEDNTNIPRENLQTICPSLLDPITDFAAPFIKEEGGETIVDGVALFNDKKMTGRLNTDETMLYLIMKDKLQKEATFTISTKVEQSISDIVTINVEKANIKKKLEFDKASPVSVSFQVNLKVGVIEYPQDELFEGGKVKDLETILSSVLTDKATKVTTKLQEAKCDGFGIGREVYAFHQKVWKEIDDWKEVYASIPITTKVNVEIVNSGIID
ncbi:Ger(x)C family spore germination protein [Sutcliffiella horikoshii]|uniref:Ger(x)C family spore germination protein n=1 Tax=Sutcliffiella horikoshii TaxID=79883 RepID=UPI002040EDC8|nr:Ger(x)C family spore germination protein [Sutcliffiella horikoshii]MCM3618371.1 Ger(x)C family spore germination protein [Sutcliffiella horikoshii]